MHFPRVPVLIRQRRAVGLELDRAGVLGVDEELGAPVFDVLRLRCDDLRLVEQLRVARGHILRGNRPDLDRLAVVRRLLCVIVGVDQHPSQCVASILVFEAEVDTRLSIRRSFIGFL